VAAVVAIVGTGAGAGAAIASSATSTPSADPAAPSTSTAGMPPATRGGAGPAPAAGGKRGGQGGKAHDPARVAWAHRYGLDRATMPNLPDVAAASPEQRAAAADLLVHTEAATARYADPAKAAAAGFDLQASLARAEKEKPGKAAAISRVDAGDEPGHMPMLHVANPANRADGKVLDPEAPETLMYEYQGSGAWKLVGVMYTANEAFPGAPPDPGGPITRWHYHSKDGPGDRLMMHVFFVPGNDLASAYAAEMAG
jgi:hypothetical protein